MKLSNPQLWARIEAYRFPTVLIGDGMFGSRVQELSFAAALAKEERLFPATATRLIAEYRRFVYLTCIAPEALTPPPMLAKVRWLHRRDQNAYRVGFCEDCLGIDWPPRPDPLVIDDAAATLAMRHLYRSEFGAMPPRDIWPVRHRILAWAI